ncbi:MAG: hypothetical protein KC620_20020, partial [Myxococcales bacterium]|nr:hypothetical protein [Myxococcales bacterium]
LFAPDPMLATLDLRTALQIRRARAHRVAKAHWRSALNALLDHQNPCPFADLRALFPNKTAQTLRDWINQTPGLTLHQNQIRRP